MNTILFILFIHFISDFILQSDKQAINKSTSNWWLTAHVMTYSLGLLIGVILFNLSKNELPVTFRWWVLINAALHWATDYGTSRINSYLWKNEMRHWFFVGIGADQMIHYVCLLKTWELLIGF